MLDSSRLISRTWLDRVEHYRELSSTQDRARGAAVDLPTDKSLLVVADRQTEGRGRGGNRWWTGDGSLAFSLIFSPARFGITAKAVPQLSLAAAAALIDAATPLLPAQPLGLHWPNDVYAAGRKLAGVLVDVLADGRHLLGVGVNTNNRLDDAPAELGDSLATFLWLTGRIIDHGDLLEAFLAQLASSLNELGRVPAEFGRRFDELCLQHGQILTVRNGETRTTGRCAGIAPDGALLLDTEQGRQLFYSGTLR